MKNDQQKIRPETAEKLFPGYKEYPSISRTGSIDGMVNIYGWKPENCFLIDGYIYHLSGHPQLRESLNKRFLTDEDLSIIRGVTEVFRNVMDDQLSGYDGKEKKQKVEQEIETMTKIYKPA